MLNLLVSVFTKFHLVSTSTNGATQFLATALESLHTLIVSEEIELEYLLISLSNSVVSIQII